MALSLKTCRTWASAISLSLLLPVAAIAQTATPTVNCQAGNVQGSNGQVCQILGAPQSNLSSTLLNDANGTAITHSFRQGSASNAAVLLLFDTSVGSNVGALGGRQRILNANLASARALVQSLPADTQVGVATFDAGKDLVAPFTTDQNAVVGALDPTNITSTGLNTFLFEAAIDAIRELQSVSAQRRVLAIFSDGESEDQAFSLTEVVNQARNAGVEIIGMASVRANSELGFAQTLERLGEETGGVALTSPIGSGAFADTDIAQLAARFGGGNTLEVPGSSFQTAGLTLPLQLSLVYTDGSVLRAPLNLPADVLTLAQATPLQTQPSTSLNTDTGSTTSGGTGFGTGTNTTTQPTFGQSPLFPETFSERVERITGLPALWVYIGVGVVVFLTLVIILIARNRANRRASGPEGPGGAARPAPPPPAAARPAPANTPPPASARAAVAAATAVAPNAAPQTVAAPAATQHAAPAATRRVTAGATKVIDAPDPGHTRAISQPIVMVRKASSGEDVKIFGAQSTMGRDPSSTVVFQDESVSRNHATLDVASDGTVTVTDLDSTNGVFVNGKKISGTAAITPKDKVRLGEAEFSIILPLAAG